MKFESKYSLGDRFVFAGCPCVIVSIEFKENSEETYKLQWVNPFTIQYAYMTKTELDNSVQINDFLTKYNGSDSISEGLKAYNEVLKEWIKSNASSKEEK